MSKNKRLVNKQYFYYLILLVGLIYGCASIQMPQGGPKDSKPPKVLKMEPKNLSVNFTANKIIIDFDEYIKLDNEFKEFSISPEMEKPPILKAKLKRLEISIQDTLEKNTTYTLNFGKAIADITESNALKNFTYVFSTGPTLDSLSISGNIKNALTGASEMETVVFILPLSRDSLFGKKKPSIYTTTDSSGNFKLNNLKKDTYKIYALKEKGGDKIYQQRTDEIGFVKDAFVLDKNIDTLHISVFKELAKDFIINDRRLNSDGSITMDFNQQLRKPEISIIDPVAVGESKITRFNKTNDSVKLWLKDLSFDSVKVAVLDDGKPLDTVKFSRGKKDNYTRVVQAGDNLSSSLLNPFKDLKLSFNFPIENIDLTKVTLLEDSIPRKGFTLTKDSSDILAYTFKYPWKKKEQYIIKFAEGSVTALFNAKNKEITKTFTLADPDNYSTLQLNITLPDSAKKYIIQLVNDKKEIILGSAVTSKTGPVIFPNYSPGTYFVRVVYDENNNGIWDTGNVAKGIQPERIWYAPKEFPIRPNWSVKEQITVPK